MGRLDVDKGWIAFAGLDARPQKIGTGAVLATGFGYHAGTVQALHNGLWVVRCGFVEPLDDAIRTTPVSREDVLDPLDGDVVT